MQQLGLSIPVRSPVEEASERGSEAVHAAHKVLAQDYQFARFACSFWMTTSGSWQTMFRLTRRFRVQQVNVNPSRPALSHD